MRNTLDRVSEDVSLLGAAALDLAKAEAAALSGELKLSGHALTRILLLVAVSLFGLFWAIAVLVFVAVEVGALWLPRWAAGLVVLALLLLVIGCIGLVVRKRWSSLESPAETVRRRLDDHRDWWRRKITERER